MFDLFFIEPYLPVAFFIFGLLLGSFANVLIYRIPLKKEFSRTRSACPKCNSLVAWYDNVPVLSWCFLLGKCRSCKKSISWRYPLVEIIMGSLFLLLYLKFGLSWLLLEYMIFVFSLVVVSFIDLDHMILPDTFTLSGIVIGLLGAALNPEREFSSALMGVLVGGGFFWSVAYLYFLIRKQEGLGGGDIKLLAWMGALLGLGSVPFVVFFSSVLGSFAGVFVLLKKNSGLKAYIPFGPFLAFAGIVYLFVGEELQSAYLKIFFPH